ncbi:MAG: M55 family metallopeptidase [Vulcanimicrobiota bacterium]
MKETADSLKAYIVADIEGSSGTWCYEDTLIGTEGWKKARRDMTVDLTAAVDALFSSGASQVVVKDFHRDGYNIVPHLLDSRARLIRGYFLKPVLMYGPLLGSNRAFFIGMHAGSGAADAFLPHTLTSRISRITIAGEQICETQLFAHVLGEMGLPVVFVSGCPAACAEAVKHLPWIVAVPVSRSDKPDDELSMESYKKEMRERLRKAITEAAAINDAPVYKISPPYDCTVTFRDSSRALRAGRWGFSVHQNTVSFQSSDSGEMMLNLIKIAYFTPLTFRCATALLPMARMIMPFVDKMR